MVMYTAISRGTLVGLVVLSIACGRSTPTAPTASSQGSAITSFPALSGLSRTFTFDHELTYRLSDYTKQSRLVLYDNGAFALQYVSLGIDYRGGETEANRGIALHLEGVSSARPPVAPWTLRE